MSCLYVIRGSLCSIAALGMITACTADERAEDAAQAPVARFAASVRSTADLGVAAWEVRPDGADARVIGRDAASARQVELIIRRDAAAPDERVRIDAVYPDAGELQLSSTGVVEAAPSDYLRRLAEDVHADLGAGATPVAGDDGLGVAVSEIGTNDQGTIHAGWNLWAYEIRQTVGGACRSGTVRDHGEIYADYGAFAVWTGWAFTAPQTDCTATFYMYINGGHWDDFHWRTFNRPINLAAGKPAGQSSTLQGALAARAVDGNTDGNWNNNSVTHTNFEAQAWWQVDLGVSTHIGQVVLFNRSDCCSERLADFDVLVSDDGATWSTVSSFIGQAPGQVAFTTNVSGRFVRVQLRGANYLSLAEVQIFAQ
jgi:NedA-like, galactose-binding domain